MTTLAIDHRIFGNGYGLASPYTDDKFYWIDGELYHWIGGLGAQLASFQWTHPKPGEKRKLRNVTFRPYLSSRRWGRVQVSWRMEGLSQDLDAMHRMIRAFKHHLDNDSMYTLPPTTAEWAELGVRA
jgi:hypothetical protein